MPLHNWTCVPAGLFHHFHQSWSIRITDALNAGILPAGVAALVEQRAGYREPDVLAIESRDSLEKAKLAMESGLATAERPKTQIIRSSSKEIYSRRANRIVVRHHLGRIVAIIEILSPGNKDSQVAITDFVDKAIDCFREGIHLLIIDLFPPTRRDPQGIHKLIWDQIEEEEFEFPSGKDRLIVSYVVGDQRVAYIEPVAVGDNLPTMPLFLTDSFYVQVPLEATYQSTWEALPEDLRTAVATGQIPDPDAE